MSIAELIHENFGAGAANKLFHSFDSGQLISESIRLRDEIETVLSKTELQRVAYLNKLTKTWTDEQQLLLLVLALVAAMQAKDLIELRDAYRYVLAPGLGNRVTASGIYAHATHVAEILGNMSWPGEAFSAVGIFDGEDDED